MQKQVDLLPESYDIMIVDDTIANLQLLSEILRSKGYKTRPVPNGKLALQAARKKAPDLFLLDINMPEMNGYELCKAIKAEDKLKDIPVIFLSALTETDDKINAFRCGGVDYITKHYQAEEVGARVSLHLSLRNREIQLKRSYEKLVQLEDARDSLTHMIVHDMRSPIQAILGFLELLQSNPDNENRNMFIDQALIANNKLESMVSSMLDINKLESGKMVLMPSTFNFNDIFESIQARLPLQDGKKIRVIDPKTFMTELYGDVELVSRILQNILNNALSYTPENGEVLIHSTADPDGVRISVQDHGPGIPEAFQKRIFEKFASADHHSGRVSTGLGLAFCKLAIQAHNGTIGVESVMGEGSTFWFQLPAKPKE